LVFDEEEHMNKDRVEGLAKEGKGKVKQTVAEVIGDEKLWVEGKIDEAQGKAQAHYGEAKGVLKKH
jgi:uncharacterized protein YjbJ (UPF0337 family)